MTPRRLRKRLEDHGFVEDRQRGSHLVMHHASDGCRVTIPMHAKEMPRGTLM